MIGLQALSVALARGAVPRETELFRLPGLPVAVRDMYSVQDFAPVRDLPWAQEAPATPVPGTCSFSNILDMRDFAFDPAFRGVAMIDFFLHRLGLPPGDVPATERRNTWLGPRLRPAMPPSSGYVLVCPRSSMRLRDMPEAVHTAVLAALAQLGARVVTQGTLASGARAMPVAENLAELCGWVAGASLVVSTDTAMVHLADAFSVPCLAVFTTHRPEWRVRDYPLCRGLHRPVAGLPEALEFARDDRDVAAAQAAWLDDGDTKWLTDAVTEAVTAQRGRHV